jgi:signal transduction histidine kinase/AraC-like DNA-binding protein
MLIYYFVTILAEALLQPYIPPYPQITPAINISMFIVQFSVVVLIVFITLRYYSSQIIKIKQLETLRLKELDEVKTKIYTNITHEFRTPLTIIMGMADQIADHPTKKNSEGLQMIRRNGQNLLHLVNQMLDLSKIEAEAMSATFYQGEIVGYLRYIFHTFISYAESKNIRLDFHSNLDQLLMDMDPEKLMQIMSNLISNAIKCSSEGGEIRLHVDKQKTNGNDELVIQVKDNGMGIPADKIPYIFDRFYKVENDLNNSSEGSGIGLALTKELVALLKGSIRVSSEPGVGTEFTVNLPVTNNSGRKHDMDPERIKSSISLFIPIPEESTAKECEEEKEESRSKNVPLLLIVEDNPDVIRYLESILRSEYTVQIAFNGQEGLDLAFDCIPDLVISDVMMPVMNGFALCEKLKTDERTSHIPVILLTAMADDVHKLEGLETGADDYLIKPFNDKELKIRTRNLIEQRRSLRERFAKNITLSPKEITVTSADERFLNRAIEIIEKQMVDSDFGVESFGKEVGMSHSQLYRKIHALTDLTPVELIRTIRLKRAASLLKQRYGNISDIAYETGFSSPSYFSECFQKQFGKSPSEFIVQD